MDPVLLHLGTPARGERWQTLLPRLVPGLTVRLWPDMGDPAAITHVAAWAPPDDLFAMLPNLTMVFSVGAGVDQLRADALPDHVALVRTVEPGLVAEMADYATLAVLALHRDLPHYLMAQRAGQWAPQAVSAKGARRVTVLGLGAMGGAIATQIAALGFPVTGWSRRPRDLPGIDCHHGADALPDVLAISDILICALPLTPATRHILNAATFARLPHGAAIVNMGRGGHLDQGALLAALETGQVAAAMLDVTEPEPLPPDHPLWRHPRVVLTPHVAAETDIDGGARAVAAAILAHRAGTVPPGLVDRSAGY